MLFSLAYRSVLCRSGFVFTGFLFQYYQILIGIIIFTTMGRIVAIDFGLKRTGLAITDEMNIIASPLTTVESKDLMTFLKELTLKNSIDTLVLGEPKRMNNEDTHITENVRMLKTALEKEFPTMKVVFIDERFTSKMAFQSMIDSGMKKKQRQEKGTVDMISAAIILQSYLG